ncbi:MAG: response regulator [Deltaproteobacteria bacterium]|jgi:response regulator of citrate/malate metabolism|nr:response regulator [Deltaproteobacteria bacterium]
MLNAIVVEDDPMVAQINREYLGKVPGLKVLEVLGSGREALDYLQSHQVDLVILDVYMPEMNGIELLRRMRLENLKADVIMVTAVNEPEQVEELLRLGVVDYLVKPFTEARFMEALSKYSVHRSTLNSGEELDQAQIDRLVSGINGSKSLPKGLHQPTWDMILSFLAETPGTFLSVEEMALLTRRSKVTIRRYLTDMAERKLVDTVIDYLTGGRPSIKYRLRSMKPLKLEETAPAEPAGRTGPNGGRPAETA